MFSKKDKIQIPQTAIAGGFAVFKKIKFRQRFSKKIKFRYRLSTNITPTKKSKKNITLIKKNIADNASVSDQYPSVTTFDRERFVTKACKGQQQHKLRLV